jgi:acid phosphatase type 7
VKSQEHEVKYLETPRFIYYISLLNLTADTTYYFRIIDNEPLADQKAVFSREYNFLTGPTSGPTSAPFSFVAGGDMGVGVDTAKMTGIAAAQNPLFVAMGGDLAYDNSMPSCYRVWDAWFDMLADKFVSPQGRLTPYLVAPGNHEAGNFWQTDKDLFSLYRPYFVREPLNGRDPLSMPSYSSHKIGSLLVLSLDSDVYVSAEEQKTWLDASLSAADQRWLSSIYHAPMWPSVRAVDDPISSNIREAWGPIFEKNGLGASSRTLYSMIFYSLSSN